MISAGRPDSVGGGVVAEIFRDCSPCGNMFPQSTCLWVNVHERIHADVKTYLSLQI